MIDMQLTYIFCTGIWFILELKKFLWNVHIKLVVFIYKHEGVQFNKFWCFILFCATPSTCGLPKFFKWIYRLL